MLRFHLYLVSNASTLQGNFKELYSMSLAFILTKISRKQPGPAFQSLKKAKIIQYTVNTVICLIQRQYFVCANSLVYYSAGSTSRQKRNIQLCHKQHCTAIYDIKDNIVRGLNANESFLQIGCFVKKTTDKFVKDCFWDI